MHDCKDVYVYLQPVICCHAGLEEAAQVVMGRERGVLGASPAEGSKGAFQSSSSSGIPGLSRYRPSLGVAFVDALLEEVGLQCISPLHRRLHLARHCVWSQRHYWQGTASLCNKMLQCRLGLSSPV